MGTVQTRATAVEVDGIELTDGLVLVRVRLVATGAQPVSVRLGPRGLSELRALLATASREIFGDGSPSDETVSLSPPGPVDGARVPGQPWRIGKWVAPIAGRRREP